MKPLKTLSPYLIVLLVLSSAYTDVQAQKWKKSKPNTLYARNKGKGVSPILVGIGTKTPTAFLHVTSTVRFQGLTSNTTTNRYVVMDTDGNLFWKDGPGGNAGTPWVLNGNTVTAADFLGTVNNDDLRIRTNNTQKAVITSAGFLGVGVAAPSAQLHTNGTVRFEGVVNNTTAQRIAFFDNSGNLFYRDLSSLPSAYWGLTGNAGTNPVNNFLGTTDNNRLVIRTNNTEKMTVLANGRLGVGTSSPLAQIHSTNSPGVITAYPYEAAVFEKSADTKLAVLTSDNSGVGGAAITLGHSNFTTAGGLFPGYEMQYGFNVQRYLRFNYLPRNSSGAVQGESANILVMTDNSRVGINLGPTAGGVTPNFPTANFHTNGTVRHEGLPTGTGNILVVDANGNVFKSTATARPGGGREDITGLKEEMDQLKKEIAELKSILNSMKGGSIDIGVNEKNAILFQNTPNPFNSTTTIRYYLPANFVRASLEISDLQGKLLKAFQLAGEGKQSVLINANELAAGIYIYTLIVNDRKVDAKKMVLTQ